MAYIRQKSLPRFRSCCLGETHWGDAKSLTKKYENMASTETDIILKEIYYNHAEHWNREWRAQ